VYEEQLALDVENMNFLCRFGKANFPFARSTMPLCLRMLIYAAFMHRKSAPSAAGKKNVKDFKSDFYC
jgi:hypothetical protein